MTDDIVKRLRERATAWNGAVRPSLDMDAADEIERLRVTALGLWGLLDGIDTISDLVKDNDKLYRQLVEKVQRRRFALASTDGYSVLFARTALSPPAQENKP